MNRKSPKGSVILHDDLLYTCKDITLVCVSLVYLIGEVVTLKKL